MADLVVIVSDVYDVLDVMMVMCLGAKVPGTR